MDVVDVAFCAEACNGVAGMIVNVVGNDAKAF